MKKPRNLLYTELLVGGFALINILIFFSMIGRPLDIQTSYGVLAVGLALIIAALVELRFDIVERKIDELRASKNHGCPRGHVWPDDGCPFCQLDSRYL